MAPGTLTRIARGKTRRVQHKLKAAESELRQANSALDALPDEVSRQVKAALRQASAAEDKVREAEQELEVVTNLLGVETAGGQSGSDTPAAGSGEGARSLLPHIGQGAQGR